LLVSATMLFAFNAGTLLYFVMLVVSNTSRAIVLKKNKAGRLKFIFHFLGKTNL